jgi:hypothetical protein
MIADGQVEAAVPVRALSVAQEFYEAPWGSSPPARTRPAWTSSTYVAMAHD